VTDCWSAGFPSSRTSVAVAPDLFRRFAGEYSLSLIVEEHTDERSLRCCDCDERCSSLFHSFDERFEQRVRPDGCWSEFHHLRYGEFMLFLPCWSAESSNDDAVAVDHQCFFPSSLLHTVQHSTEQLVWSCRWNVWAGGIGHKLDIGGVALNGETCCFPVGDSERVVVDLFESKAIELTRSSWRHVSQAVVSIDDDRLVPRKSLNRYFVKTSERSVECPWNVP
jgi:hypothetical protein